MRKIENTQTTEHTIKLQYVLKYSHNRVCFLAVHYSTRAVHIITISTYEDNSLNILSQRKQLFTKASCYLLFPLPQVLFSSAASSDCCISHLLLSPIAFFSLFQVEKDSQMQNCWEHHCTMRYGVQVVPWIPRISHKLRWIPKQFT